MASSGVTIGADNSKPNGGLDTTQTRQAFFQKAITRMATHWNDSEAVKAIEIDSLDKERETILKAIALAMDVPDAWAATKELTVNFMPYMERRGHWDEWHEVLEKAIVAAQVHDDADSEITFTALLARLCLRQSRYKESVQLSRKVIQVAKRSGNKFEEARACSNLGFYFINKGHLWRSEILCCHALNIFESLESNHGIAHTHNHLGLLHSKKQNLKQAEKYFQLAGGLAIKIRDTNLLATVYGNLGLLYINDILRFDEAEYYLTNAIEIAEISGEKAHLASLYLDLSIAHINRGSFDFALTLLDKSESIYKTYSNKVGQGLIWHNKGQLYLRQNNFSEGKRNLKKAIDRFSELELGIDLAKALSSLIEFGLENRLQVKQYISELKTTIEKYGLTGNKTLKTTIKKIADAQK